MSGRNSGSGFAKWLVLFTAFCPLSLGWSRRKNLSNLQKPEMVVIRWDERQFR